MQIDVNKYKHKKYNKYKYSYDQSCLVLHLARIDKVVQNLWHFFHNFWFKSYNSKTISWAWILAHEWSSLYPLVLENQTNSI